MNSQPKVTFLPLAEQFKSDAQRWVDKGWLSNPDALLHETRVKAWPVIGEPVTRDPNLCRIFSHGLLRSERCHAPEDGAGGAGGAPAGAGAGGEPEKKFTQADIDAVVGKRVKEATSKFADFDKYKTAFDEVGTLKQKLEALEEEKATAGKTVEEKERMAGEKARKAMERSLEDANTKTTVAEKRALEADQRYRNLVIGSALGSALDKGKVLQSGREDAIEAFRRCVKIELDEDAMGSVKSIEYNGATYKTVDEAAIAFLQERKHFAAAQASSGGGTRPPNTGGGTNGRPLHEMSEDELLRSIQR